ncbi:glycosyltransferase [Streptosporangium lutulentum]|uniref:Glycosyltransferase involved in cell wall biosynthesis n=1 Tax=Streptosporangium lutulentum TaxID=1461250 RepID=A0ABT9QIU5_9ACTN|nr:glycosyltransferase [Streptosporangium lutulentum]MDP9846675.1 glycosyltransferase involved in cell wall biosynthesis [Streptosporangium lutulentum]
MSGPEAPSVVFACMDADTLGGIQRVTHTVAQGLAERGHDVHVIGLHRAEIPFRYVERPRYTRHVIHRTPVGRLSPRGARRERRTLRGLFRQVGPGFAVLSSPGVVTRLKPLLPERLLPIGQYHGSYEHARGSWHLGSVRGHYGGLEKAVFLSEDDAWLFSEHALLPNTWTIPNPLPVWPSRTADLSGHRVLGVGRLEGVKRFDRLISAFAEACRGDVDAGWELHLIGEGAELDRLRAHALTCGVAGQVVFRGTVAASGMEREYLEGSVLGLSSEHEGLPLVIGEAASYGVPTVAFDVSGGVRSLVLDRETGLLAPPGDVTAFATALGTLMASARERRRLGTAARAHVGAFTLDRVLDRWEALFEQVTR